MSSRPNEKLISKQQKLVCLHGIMLAENIKCCVKFHKSASETLALPTLAYGEYDKTNSVAFSPQVNYTY
jgi:hypothetical protein